VNAFLAKVRAAGEDARLRFLRILNRFAIVLLGGVVVANTMYSGVLTGWFTKLPPYVGIPVLIVFGSLVEYASRRPKDPA
jgi:hypothetical protein